MLKTANGKEAITLVNGLRLRPDEKVDIYLVLAGRKPAAIVTSNSHELSSISRTLSKLGLEYDIDVSQPALSELAMPIFVAGSEGGLAALMKAFAIGSDSDIGVALGYPPEAIRAYSAKEPNWARLGNVLRTNGATSTWPAYLSWVPEEMNRAAPAAQSQSELLARRHNEFVEKTNPELAKEVEYWFHEQVMSELRVEEV